MGGVISKLIARTIFGERIPAIVYIPRYPTVQPEDSNSIDCQNLDPIFFDQFSGITIVTTESERQTDPETADLEALNAPLIEQLEKVILEIKSQLKCENVLLVECHVFHKSTKSFRFFTHEEHAEISSVGHFLKGTFKFQSGAVFDEAPIGCNRAIIDHFEDSLRKVHCFQMSFSSKMVEEDKPMVELQKSKFKYGLFASIYVAVTKMRTDSGEL